MEFNTLIKEELLPILEKVDFRLSQEFENIIRFESSFLQINIVYNDYEKSNFIEVGNKNNILYPLNDSVVKNVFKSELPIDQVTPNIFVRNLGLIFEKSPGLEILKGNIKKLVDYVEKESNDYTLEIVQRQTLETASKAWEKNNYKAFVKIIDEIGIEKLPKSYQLKYKMAKQKV